MPIPPYKCPTCRKRLVLWCKATGQDCSAGCYHTLRICPDGCDLARDTAPENQPLEV